MPSEFQQVQWDAALEDDCRALVRLAVREDLDRRFDVTTLALVAREVSGAAEVMARQPGTICGLRAAALALDEMEIMADWQPHVVDGDAVPASTPIATFSGSARDLLTAERLILNLIGRLSGIATLTRAYVDLVAGSGARIYDTRKTTPGWRRLEKYAVRCGGGCNHRTGLFDAVLIKDNHLALVSEGSAERLSPAQAVLRARQSLAEMLPGQAGDMIVEVEVDSLEQLDQVLTQQPDIVLLDNMTPEQLRSAVARRDQAGVSTQLEASGGVNLKTVRAIAQTGVERISVGALTHSATALDVALDWKVAK